MTSEANTMDEREPLSSSRVEARSFEDKFREFSNRIQYLRDCLSSSQELISKLQEISKDCMHSDVNRVFISEEENQELNAFASKRASILVVGQTNSGKSSLINELLGATHLPTDELPCTSRIVRVRYSTDNFIQVHRATGEYVQEKRFYGKTVCVPREEIVLDDSQRNDRDLVRCVVEVGLNNPLLQGDSLEFVDAPGMSENDVIDSMVKECLHGILQVVIYVIDGNSLLRRQDREFLFNLKVKIGRIPIFFVCNKVDLDEKAEYHDRDSDEDEDTPDPEARWESIQGKKRRAFSELVDCGMISKGTELGSCKFFYGVSTREVKIARIRKLSNRYTCDFEEMKKSFLDFVADSINSHLGYTSCLLSHVQRRIFEFFISPDPKRCNFEQMSEVLQFTKVKGETYFEKICYYVKENQPKLQNMISSGVKNSDILMEAEAMTFMPIQIGDICPKHEIINQCWTQLQNMVLLRVLNDSTQKVTTFLQAITASMKEQLQVSLQGLKKQDYLADKLFEDLIRLIYLGPRNINQMLQMNFLDNFSSSNLTHQARDEAARFFEDGKAWKRRSAKTVLDSIDYERVSKQIANALLDDLSSKRASFVGHLQRIEELYETADKQSDIQQRCVSEQCAPPFAEVTCRTEALIETLSYPDVQLLDEVGRRGHRGTVNNCETFGKFGERKVVAMQAHGKVSKVQHMAIQHCLRRINVDHDSVLRPLAMVLVDFTVTLLLPKCTTDLFTALKEGVVNSLPLATRLTIVQHMTEACIFCREKGLQLIDPRITNVMLDGNYHGKLNICKPRDDTVPYPDDLAPFHVRSAPPPLLHASPKVLQLTTSHDVYSLGIMGWLLGVGKYARPSYANTEDVQDIYNAVNQGVQPEVTLISQEVEAEYEGFITIILECFDEKCSLEVLMHQLGKLFNKTSQAVGT